jgi:Flp pilus assembly protein TadG
MRKSISRQAKRLVKEERAVALTEFALVAPLLFLVLFGMIDFGKGINYWIDQTHLASEGARLVVVSGGSTTVPGNCPNGAAPTTGATYLQTLANYIQCQTNTKELLKGGTASVPTKTSVCFRFPTGGAVGQPVDVKVTATYNWLPFIGNNIGITQTPIAGQATERLESKWPGSYVTNQWYCSS